MKGCDFYEMVLFRVLVAVLLNSLLPRVKEQLIKYLKNEFVADKGSRYFVNGTYV